METVNSTIGKMGKQFAVGLGFLALACFCSMSALASSDARCQNAWSQSAASNSCYGGQNSNSSAFVEWRSGRQECIVSAYCSFTNASGGQSWKYNQEYASVSDVRQLHNCDGTLKVDNC